MFVLSQIKRNMLHVSSQGVTARLQSISFCDGAPCASRRPNSSDQLEESEQQRSSWILFTFMESVGAEVFNRTLPPLSLDLVLVVWMCSFQCVYKTLYVLIEVSQLKAEAKCIKRCLTSSKRPLRHFVFKFLFVYFSTDIY